MRFRKLSVFVSALCMMCAVAPVSGNYPPEQSAVVANAGDTYENLIYTKNADSIEISGHAEDIRGELVIPAEIDGLPVTDIKASAFFECSGLTSVVIPDSVTSIGNSAFSRCFNLASVRIGNGMTAIGEYAFGNCTALTSVNIPDGVASIGYSAFYCCSGLTSVSIPDSVTSIGESAFEYCSGLTNIRFGRGVTDIRSSAFYGCSGLTGIVIPKSVTSIGSYAFAGCSRLISVTIRNAECRINDNPETISDTAVIYGYENSTAKTYADKYSREFVSVDGVLQSGDVNGDNEIDIRDVIMINQAIFGKVTLTDEQSKAADINGNGMPDAEDSLSVLKYIVKIIDTLN